MLSLVTLLRCSWFHRLWVWQEIHLASLKSVLIWGENEILWHTFRSAICAIYRKGFKFIKVHFDIFYEFHQLIGEAVDICRNNSQLIFMDLILATKSSLCSDTRDRIYALLSLVSRDQIDIKPDYTKPMKHVFQEATESHIRKSNSLDLLSICELHPKREKMPSWIPDFSTPTEVDRIIARHLTSTLSRFPEIGGTLGAQGVQISKIKKLWKSKIRLETTPSEIGLEFVDLLSKIDSEYPIVPEIESLAEILVRTISRNRFSECYHPVHPRFPTGNAIRQFLEYIRTYHSIQETPLFSDLHRLLHNVRRSLKGRSVFTTANGHIGICTAFAKKGDIAALLVGCQSLLILRPTDKGLYSVVGAAYSYSIVNCEPFLGSSLPEVDRLWTLNTNYPLFLNRQTGEISCEDPRLGDLPPGWTRIEHENQAQYSIFRDGKSSKNYFSTDFDPRTFPEELEKRGVKLERFELA